jgi:uncharacterized protein YeeX (DUF496 family)
MPSCAVCHEDVEDADPTCCECKMSFCFDCPTTYDSLSRLFIVFSKINVLYKPVLTKSELKEIIKDFQSEQVIEHIHSTEKYYETKIETYRNDSVNIIQSINTIIEKLIVSVDNIIDDNSVNNCEISKTNNEHNIKILDELFFILNSIEFKCLMCHKGIKLTY